MLGSSPVGVGEFVRRRVDQIPNSVPWFLSTFSVIIWTFLLTFMLSSYLWTFMLNFLSSFLSCFLVDFFVKSYVDFYVKSYVNFYVELFADFFVDIFVDFYVQFYCLVLLQTFIPTFCRFSYSKLLSSPRWPSLLLPFYLLLNRQLTRVLGFQTTFLQCKWILVDTTTSLKAIFI